MMTSIQRFQLGFFNFSKTFLVKIFELHCLFMHISGRCKSTMCTWNDDELWKGSQNKKYSILDTERSTFTHTWEHFYTRELSSV